MKRVLSIDWDYFINATAEERMLLFPDGGNENISYALQDFIWNTHYADPKLKDIKVHANSYKVIRDILQKFIQKYLYSKSANPHREVMITISHRWIYDFIMQRTNKDEQFEVYNVDFHHDMYHYRTEDQEVNCGNWANCLLEQRPNMKYCWIPREDSEVTVIGGEAVPCETRNLEELLDLDFDYVFICRSDCWSPPHLDTYFEILWKYIRKYMPVEVENQVAKCRIFETPNSVDEAYSWEKYFKSIMD